MSPALPGPAHLTAIFPTYLVSMTTSLVLEGGTSSLSGGPASPGAEMTIISCLHRGPACAGWTAVYITVPIRHLMTTLLGGTLLDQLLTGRLFPAVQTAHALGCMVGCCQVMRAQIASTLTWDLHEILTYVWDPILMPTSQIQFSLRPMFSC